MSWPLFLVTWFAVSVAAGLIIGPILKDRAE